MKLIEFILEGGARSLFGGYLEKRTSGITQLTQLQPHKNIFFNIVQSIIKIKETRALRLSKPTGTTK